MNAPTPNAIDTNATRRIGAGGVVWRRTGNDPNVPTQNIIDINGALQCAAHAGIQNAEYAINALHFQVPYETKPKVAAIEIRHEIEAE